jgi:hypothetical protein
MAEACERKLPLENAALLHARARLSSDAFVLRRGDRGLSSLYRTAVSGSRRKRQIPVEAASRVRPVVAGGNSRCCRMVLCAANPGSAPRQIGLRVRWTRSFPGADARHPPYACGDDEGQAAVPPTARGVPVSVTITRAPTSDQRHDQPAARICGRLRATVPDCRRCRFFVERQNDDGQSIALPFESLAQHFAVAADRFGHLAGAAL